LLLFDPLSVPSEIDVLAAERETAIALTAAQHERDAQSLVERLAVPGIAHAIPDGASLSLQYSYLDPERRQLCWSHLVRDFTRPQRRARSAEGLGKAGPVLAASLPGC
jgi:hypothetical protein